MDSSRIEYLNKYVDMEMKFIEFQLFFRHVDGIDTFNIGTLLLQIGNEVKEELLDVSIFPNYELIVESKIKNKLINNNLESLIPFVGGNLSYTDKEMISLTSFFRGSSFDLAKDYDDMIRYLKNHNDNRKNIFMLNAVNEIKFTVPEGNLKIEGLDDFYVDFYLSSMQLKFNGNLSFEKYIFDFLNNMYGVLFSSEEFLETENAQHILFKLNLLINTVKLSIQSNIILSLNFYDMLFEVMDTYKLVIMNSKMKEKFKIKKI